MVSVLEKILLTNFVDLFFFKDEDSEAVQVSNEMANRMSLFYAYPTPLLKVLSDATSKFVTEVGRNRQWDKKALLQCRVCVLIAKGHISLSLNFFEMLTEACEFLEDVSQQLNSCVH